MGTQGWSGGDLTPQETKITQNNFDALVSQGRDSDPELPAQESPWLKQEASADASSRLLCWHGSRLDL